MSGAISSTTPASATASGATAGQERLKKAAQAFEAVFLRQMIGSMRQADLGDGLFDSSATDQFRDMADARVADDMARKGGFGVAEVLVKQYGAKVPAAPAVVPGK